MESRDTQEDRQADKERPREGKTPTTHRQPCTKTQCSHSQPSLTSSKRPRCLYSREDKREGLPAGTTPPGSQTNSGVSVSTTVERGIRAVFGRGDLYQIRLWPQKVGGWTPDLSFGLQIPLPCPLDPLKQN